MQRNKMIGMGIIGFGLLTVIIIFVVVFGRFLIPSGGGTTINPFNLTDTVTIQKPIGDEGFVTYDVRILNLYRRPGNLFETDQVSLGDNLVFQMEVELKNSNATNFSEQNPEELIGYFDIFNKTPGGQFLRSDISLNSVDYQEYGISTLSDLEIIPNETKTFSLLFQIPVEANEFEIHIYSVEKIKDGEPSEIVDYIYYIGSGE